ncbi:MAG: hypothetical protein ACI8W8_000097, partial [Rhodothermales bacterium]
GELLPFSSRFGPNQASAPGKAIQIRLCDPFRANFFRFCDGV